LKSEFLPYINVIKNNILFCDLKTEEIENRLHKMNATFKDYKKGGILHISGNPLEKFGLVVYGTVNILTDDTEGNRTIMAEVTKGNTFGESLSFLKIQNPDIYVCASEDSGVIWLSSSVLFNNTDDYDLEVRFAKMIAKRTLNMNERIQILSKLTLKEKILTYLNYLSKKSNSNKVTVPFNREDMATYIGTNRTALSRELSKLKKEGIIDYCKNNFELKFK